MKTTALLFLFFVFVVIVEIDGGKFGGGGGRSRGSSSRGSSSSSYGGSRSQSSSNHARNNWNAAREKVRNPSPPRQEPKPKQQPNYENTKLSYGHHEVPQSKPNDHKPSAPPMETNHKPPISTVNQGSQNINKQTVTNQQSGAPPSAPNAPNSPNSPPIGWNVNQNPQNPHNSQGIGFDNVNKQAAGGVPHVNQNPQNQHNSQGIGFDNVNKQAAGGVPHVNHPAGTANQQQGINSQNVHPSQNAYNPNGGYQPNTGPGGYNPGGYNQGGYHPGGYNQGGYNQGGYNQGGYNQGGYHPGGYNQGQGGYHGYPQQPGGYGGHGGYGGYGGYGGGYHPPAGNVHYGPVTYINGASTPSYSYYQRPDNTLLSLFIGYQVGKMFSHSHTPYFSGHTYEIHHYHHNVTTQPEKVTVQANTIVACAENITLLCITNSYPVCMSNGTIMCVTNPQLTAPCKDFANFSCVEVDCKNNTACNGTETKDDKLNVPCVSSVSIFGDLSMLQNIINTTAQVPDNVTVITTNNSLSVTNLETTTATAATTITTAGETTTVVPGNTTNTTHTTNVITNNVYCVTVIAMPRPVIEVTTTPAPLPEMQEKATPHLSQPHVSDPRSSANYIWPKTTLMGFICLFVPFVSNFYY